MRKSTFRFKQFECEHGCGSIKIGVDAVLLGAWTTVTDTRRILDVGTGCGVIAMMCAQRNADAVITAIDIDAASVEEAAGNFARSLWSSRLEASLLDFSELSLHDVDLIVSNPPYFDSGVTERDTPRLVARHQGELSPDSLLQRGSAMLSDSGRISMIVPASENDFLSHTCIEYGMAVSRRTFVRGHLSAPVKRVLLEFVKVGSACPSAQPVENLLTLEIKPGVPHPDHISLCKDFYLKF